jgi:hypothetical protein
LQGEHLPAGVGNEALQLAKAHGSIEQVIANPQLQPTADTDDPGRTPRGFLLFCHLNTPSLMGRFAPLSQQFLRIVGALVIGYVHYIQRERRLTMRG